MDQMYGDAMDAEGVHEVQNPTQIVSDSQMGVDEEQELKMKIVLYYHTLVSKLGQILKYKGLIPP